MSSEEEDYMSNAFLSGITDVRPSLIHDRRKKRLIQLEEQKVEYNKKQKHSLQSQSNGRLQEGLQCPIESQNKGFKLLAKMGYKPGDSLGKSSTGIKEPIGLTIKSDRAGFGRETALKEIELKRKELRAKHFQRKLNEANVTPEIYRSRMTEKAQDRFVESALRKCQKSCEDLDQRANVEEPHLKWFWPDRSPPPEDDENNKDAGDEEEDEVEYSSAEKLEMLTSYMRMSYTYCHWCGVHYKDVEDLDDNCPGLTKDDH